MIEVFQVNDSVLGKFEHRKLAFEKDKIRQLPPDGWVLSSPLPEVMMGWEDELMKRHAEVACQNGGDILEVGFGMGISATYIQEQNPKSHTIVEIHPQVLEKLDAWAAGRENVKIVRGDWHKKFQRGKLDRYDGVFYDGFGDLNFREIGKAYTQLCKKGGIFTFWNAMEKSSNVYGIDAIYETIAVDPPENSYFNNGFYYLPKVINK